MGQYTFYYTCCEESECPGFPRLPCLRHMRSGGWYRAFTYERKLRGTACIAEKIVLPNLWDRLCATSCPAARPDTDRTPPKQ